MGQTTADMPPGGPTGGGHSSAAVVEFIGEFAATAVHANGEVFAERMEKTDGNTSACLAADAGRPTIVSVQRTKGVTNFDDEGIVVGSLAIAYNAFRGTADAVEEKPREDNEYPDRVLVSHHDDPARLIVQVRNLDDEMIGGLGRDRHFNASQTIDERIAKIDAAISDKAKLDRGVKSKTILLLWLPSPIGQMTKQLIQQHVFDLRGFKAIWISPFHEKCFPLG
jgi:hypothetical protein